MISELLKSEPKTSRIRARVWTSESGLQSLLSSPDDDFVYPRVQTTSLVLNNILGVELPAAPRLI